MVAGCGAMTESGVVRCDNPVGAVVPSCGQFMAQQRRAAVASVVLSGECALAQQSILLI